MHKVESNARSHQLFSSKESDRLKYIKTYCNFIYDCKPFWIDKKIVKHDGQQ